MMPMPAAMSVSTDSVQSALRISEAVAADSGQASRKFMISVGLIDFKDLAAFCTRACTGNTETSVDRTFWFSWIILEKTFQSDEFTAGTEPQKIRDIIRVRCSEDAMMKIACDEASLRIFLCTQGNVIAAVSIPLLQPTVVKEAANFPLSMAAWHDLERSLGPNVTRLNKPAIKIGVTISYDQEGTAGHVISTKAAPTVPRRFSSSPLLVEYNALQDSSEHRSDPEILMAVDNCAVVSFSENIDGKKNLAGRRVRRSRNRNQDELCETSSEDAGESYDETDNDGLNSSEEDDYTRHYRLSVEVKSIGGLRRAANASIHFTYPFFGAGGSVRTHPVWLPANSEGRVDGAVASYDCCMSRNRIRDLLAEHPLKISAVSRTHLGSANIGEVSVDLFGLLESKPHSYRCAMSSKAFKTTEEYISHRQSLLALRSLGQIDRVPAKDPITVWADDSFLPLTVDKRKSSDMAFLGGRLRVVVIIEEIGIVGAQIATSVKPGYKMHNGALYVVKDSQPEIEMLPSAAPSVDETVEMPPLPSDRVGLTESERVLLDKLRGEWETFRMASEVQWRNSLRDREAQMRSKLEAETSRSLADRADDLRRAQEEAGRLEVRLRGAIEEAERQRNQLKLREEQMQMNLAQRTSELQLLQRRVKDEAKARIDAEVLKSSGLLSQVNSQKQQIEKYEKRVKDVEKEFESFRAYSRGTPESVLREEVARVRAQLGESRAEVERERRIKSEADLEKEHFRAQMHRLAIALKRERERSSASARQDLDQLRLEFLAREERYVLDGDREELRNIRHELANLRTQSHGQANTDRPQGSCPSPPPNYGPAQIFQQSQQRQPSSVYQTSNPIASDYSRDSYSDQNIQPPSQSQSRASAPSDVRHVQERGSRSDSFEVINRHHDVSDGDRDRSSETVPSNVPTSSSSSSSPSYHLRSSPYGIEGPSGMKRSSVGPGSPPIGTEIGAEEEEEEEEGESPRPLILRAQAAPIHQTPSSQQNSTKYTAPVSTPSSPSPSLSTAYSPTAPGMRGYAKSISQSLDGTARFLKQEIQSLLDTDMYEDGDPVIDALRRQLEQAESECGRQSTVAPTAGRQSDRQ